jgi:hypothetical protein
MGGGERAVCPREDAGTAKEGNARGLGVPSVEKTRMSPEPMARDLYSLW